MKKFIPLLLMIAATQAFAGGPLLVGSPTYGISGQPFRWDNTKSIHYRVDGGKLGTQANGTAITTVNNAFATWTQIPGVKLTVQNLGAIQGVTDGDVSTAAEYDAVSATCDAGTQSPIILDDGTLVQALTGDPNVLGFSGPCNIDPATGTIKSAFSLLSGPVGISSGELTAEVVHELGHFIGLDHTDTGKTFEGTSQADIDGTPTMFYQLITPLMATPKTDDKAWLAKLYPASNYASLYGTITGQVLFSDGVTPVQDVLVIARNTSNPHTIAVANISGYRFSSNPGQKISTDYMPCVPATECTGGTWGDNPGSSNGSHDASLIGLFEIPVPPGQYTVEVHALGDDGSIGPFDPVLPMPGPAEYWNSDESNHDWATVTGWLLADANPTPITVAAGQTVANINIILNDTEPTYDVFEQPATPSASRQTAPEGGVQ